MTAWEWQKDGGSERVWSEVNEKGWALVRWPDAAERTARDSTAFCQELLDRTPVNHRYAKLQVVAGVDKGYEQTQGPADLHTDQHPYMPAQIQVLACVKPASDGGESTFVDLWSIASAIEREDAALFERLFVPRAVVFGRSVWFGGTISWRHGNLIFVHPAIRPDPADDVGARFRERVRRAAPLRIPLKAGEVVIANNHRLVHGRTGFTDPSRLIVRELFWLREPMPAPEGWIARARAVSDRLCEKLQGEPSWIHERFGFLGEAGMDSPLITSIVQPTPDRKSDERKAELEGVLRRVRA